MSSIDGEQFIASTILVNGTHVAASASAMKAASIAANCYTFTANYTFVWNGQHVQFVKGRTYALDAAEKAALLALSAPMTVA